MNVYVLNCSNTFNYGSMMMGENFIKYFNEFSSTQNNFYFETEDYENIERLRVASQFENIYPAKNNGLFDKNSKKISYITGLLKTSNIYSDLYHKIDLVVVLGGGDFTEDYGWKGPIINAIKFSNLSKSGKKIVMLGQTMGPYKSFRRFIMKKLLSNLNGIYPRDPITYKYLKLLGLKNIFLMDDLALLPLAKEKEIVRTKDFVTFCPSELIYRYSKEGDRKDWIDFNLFVINEIMTKYSDIELVLLAHVLKPKYVDDRIIVREIYELLKNVYPDRIILEDNLMYPFEVRNYIKRSKFTISSRMHPIISSIESEVPVITFSYSSKYWGIIGERYGLGDFIIDVRYFNYAEMKKKFVEIIENIDDNYDTIKNNMHEKNILAKDNILNSFHKITK